MQPLLQNGERLFVNRLIYKFEDVHRGDVIVFYCPDKPYEFYIKRVIGLPGEQLRIVQNKVYINGQPIDDPYVPEYFQPNNPPGEPPINLATMTIPIGHYFVSGDHRNRSLDSRIWANPRNKLYSPFIPEKYIIGKAAFRYWPLSKFGIIPSYEYDDPEVQTES